MSIQTIVFILIIAGVIGFVGYKLYLKGKGFTGKTPEEVGRDLYVKINKREVENIND
jgi:hypothetical protein